MYLQVVMLLNYDPFLESWRLFQDKDGFAAVKG